MSRPGGGECSTRLTSWVGVDGSRWRIEGMADAGGHGGGSKVWAADQSHS
jgi:hypothetical protein